MTTTAHPGGSEPTPRRPGDRGSRERLDRTHPTGTPPDTPPPPYDADTVQVILTGRRDDLAALLPTLPGLRITDVTGPGAERTNVHATITAGVHHYLSTACLHEAMDPDSDRAADLHAYCESGKLQCGDDKIGAVCKWCPAPCTCAAHDHDSVQSPGSPRA